MMGDASRLRIFFFHAYPHQYAGAQRVVCALGTAFEERGHRTVVVTPERGPFLARLADAGIECRVVRAPSPWRRYGGALEGALAVPALATLPLYWLRLAHALREWRPDVLHCNDHRGMLLAGPAACLAGVPLLWHVHGAYGSEAINRMGVRLAGRVIVVSRATMLEQPALAREAGGKVAVVHNGLLPADKASRPVASGRCRQGSPTIVCGARVHPEKGLDVLVRASALLAAEFPAIRVNIVGNVQAGYEEHARALRDLAEHLGVEARVNLVGPVRDPLCCWRDATVYVQPSRAEPFGLCVLEAMSVGTPVVVTSVGGLQETVDDGVTGLRVPPEDPAALAQAIRRLVRDEALARRLVSEAKRRLDERFSCQAMVERFLSEYRFLARRGGRRA